MALLSKPAFGPKVALIYVTVGALIDVWTTVYYFAFVRGQTPDSKTWFWLAGLFLTGITLVILGLVLGPLGRAARKAELPPAEVTRAEAQVQHTAAAAGAPAMVGVPPAPPQPPVLQQPVYTQTAGS